MKAITFVITTRNLPIHWKQAFLLEIEKNLIDADVRDHYTSSCYFDVNTNKVIVKSKETDSVNGNKYTVYVVPCMQGSYDSTIDAQWRNNRFEFLEKLLIEVGKKEEQKTGEKELYLIAHDKDFGENEDNIIYQPKNTFPKEYVTLKKLVNNYRVFLFKHEDGAIYCKISGLVDSSFDNSCDALYDFMREKIEKYKKLFARGNH